MKEDMTDVTLHDWQEEVVNKIDRSAFYPIELTWRPSPFGSSFQEFDMFNIHSLM